jgi:hypothetical protein
VVVNDLFQEKNQRFPYLKATIQEQMKFSGRFEGS